MTFQDQKHHNHEWTKNDALDLMQAVSAEILALSFP